MQSNHQPADSLTVVVPFFDEAETADALILALERLEDELRRRGLAMDVVLVDDGSTDGGAEVFARKLRGRWKIVRFSRNFGKEIALFAGIEQALGSLVLQMDADLQHSVEVGLRLVDTILADDTIDVVYAQKASRRDGSWRRAQLAKMFYTLINLDKRFRIPPDAGDFRVMRSHVARAFSLLRDKRRFNKGLYAWAGFNARAIEYVPDVRVGGTSKWSRLLLLGLSIEAFTSFSVLPLRFMSAAGVVAALAGMAYGVKMLFEVLFYGIAVPGYPSVMVAVAFLGGLNLMLLGLVGEYVWAALNEAKDRPLYIVREVLSSHPAGAGETAHEAADSP